MKLTHCLAITALTLFATACSSPSAQQAPPPDTDSVPHRDSTALVVAVCPTADCLPLYFAAEKGLFRKNGVEVILQNYLSQADCDTAYLGQTADGGLTDLVRANYHGKRDARLEIVSGTDGEWTLMANGKLRIKDIRQLKRHSVSWTRYSAAHYLMVSALKAAGTDPAEVFPIQVNDLELRTRMLNENQTDAALLPEPYAAIARRRGQRTVSLGIQQPRLGCMVFRREIMADDRKGKQIKLFLKTYDQAVDSINGQNKNRLAPILSKYYRLDATDIDSLRLPRYRHAAVPEKTDYAL